MEIFVFAFAFLRAKNIPRSMFLDSRLRSVVSVVLMPGLCSCSLYVRLEPKLDVCKTIVSIELERERERERDTGLQKSVPLFVK